jgi:hypothetical protein
MESQIKQRLGDGYQDHGCLGPGGIQNKKVKEFLRAAGREIGDDTEDEIESDTTDSCEDSSDQDLKVTDDMTEEIKQMTLKKKKARGMKKKQSFAHEHSYEIGEVVDVQMDVYNITIIANMTKNCSSTNLLISIRYCVLVFLIQVLLAYFFQAEMLNFDQFQDLDLTQTALRLICSMLLQVNFQEEFNKAFAMFTLVKRMKGSRNNAKGRLINIGLTSM